MTEAGFFYGLSGYFRYNEWFEFMNVQGIITPS